MSQPQPSESREPRECCRRCGAPWPWARPPQSAGLTGDVTILAAVVVFSIILIVAFSTAIIVRYLRAVVDDAGRAAPPASYAAWLEARRARAGGPA